MNMESPELFPPTKPLTAEDIAQIVRAVLSESAGKQSVTVTSAVPSEPVKPPKPEPSIVGAVVLVVADSPKGRDRYAEIQSFSKDGFVCGPSVGGHVFKVHVATIRRHPTRYMVARLPSERNMRLNGTMFPLADLIDGKVPPPFQP